MDRETAIQIFNKGLNTLLGTGTEPFVQLAWFAEDFDNYMQDYIEEIFRRIENPPYLEKIKALQSACPLIALFGLLIKIPTINRVLIVNRIPETVQVIIKRNDTEANILIRQYIDAWFTEGYISPTLLLMIKKAFDTQITSQWKQPEETIKEEQPHFEETITETDDKQLKFRPWMLSSTLWEKGKSEDISSISFNDTPKAGKVRKYVRVTPDNENATCSVCSGKFNRVNHPKYGIVFENVEFIKGSGYIHTGCLSHLKSFLY